MNKKKFKDRYMTSINVERDVFFGIDQLLPRGVSVTDEINGFLKQRYEELKNEKNLIAELQDNSAIKNLIVGQSIIQTTLDKYLPPWIRYHQNWEQQNKVFDLCNEKEARSVYSALKITTERWNTKLRSKFR